MALVKPGKLRKFFLLLCGHPILVVEAAAAAVGIDDCSCI